MGEHDEPQQGELVAEVEPDLTPEEAEEFKPSGRELVVRDPADPNEVFSVLDRHDEEQIVEEFQRRALKVMLYDFEQGSKQMIDLSYQGVNEAIRLMNRTGKCRIKVAADPQPQITQTSEDIGRGEDEPIWRVMVYAVDEVTGYGQWGIAEQPCRMKLRNGSFKADEMALRKALSKAQRNALKTHIPEPMRQTLIAQYQGNEVALRQIRAGVGAEAEAELPPPLDDERARELNERIRATYDEIREVSKLALLPGAFYARHARTQHDHGLMEEFLAYLEGLRDHVRREAQQGATA